jgi:ribosomal protein S15P/S13E
LSSGSSESGIIHDLGLFSCPLFRGNPKETLIERKGRLEKTIADLQRERANVAAQLKARILSDEQIETLVDRIRKVGKALQVARRDFETQRYFVDMLDVTARLAVEDGEKAVHPRCILGEGPRLIVSNTTNRAACP